MTPRSLVAETADSTAEKSEFVFCLNTGTIRGQKLGIVKEIEVASKAGYQAIEPWVEAIDQYAKAGGSLVDLKNRIQDAGLSLESAIGFPEWIVDDDARRAKGMERAKYEMDLLSKLGGKRLAAPPAGATEKPGLDLDKAAERYRALLEAGEQAGIVPELEVWGFSKNLNKLSVCAHVAIESGHPNACVLADIFHLYKGGSNINGLKLLSGRAIQVFHMNDYPADPPVDKINDSYRIFPGDGVAPMDRILRMLHSTGGRKVLSLELFNKKYWEQDALDTAKQGLAKLKAAVQKALA
jgi:sugar phosphate isomerase/epimerase